MYSTRLDFSRLKVSLSQVTANLKSQQVEVGFLDGGITQDAPRLHDGKTIQDVAKYAAINEYGSSTIPARPFMHTAAQSRGNAWKDAAAKALQHGYNSEQALTLAGVAMRDDIRASITGAFGAWAPNAPETIAAKTRVSVQGGKAVGTQTPQPLIDTGDMLRSVGYKIEELEDERS